MRLGEAQEAFARKATLLMLHLHTRGYSMRGGYWQRCDDCELNSSASVHPLKLALDINLTLSPADGEHPRLLTGTAADKAHNILHDYFDTIGGAPRIPGDLNHYSDEWRGRR